MARHCAGLLFLLGISIPSHSADPAPPDVLDLINRMSAAVRTVNYEGVFIYRHERQTDSLRLIHRGGSGVEQERLISLTGPAREVIRNGDAVTCIYPDDQSVVVERMKPRNFVVQLPEPATHYSNIYDFALAGAERVAGRAAWVVSIRPKDEYRYGYQMWIDSESFLPLKTELRSRKGAVIEEIMFTQIEVLPEIPDAHLEPGISGQGLTWFHAAAAAERDPAGGQWRTAWMPEGFHISRYQRRELLANGDPVDHLVYTDGMTSVSVFVEQLRDTAPLPGPRRVGGISTFSGQQKGHQITAVGEVLPATVQRMVNSMISE